MFQPAQARSSPTVCTGLLAAVLALAGCGGSDNTTHTGATAEQPGSTTRVVPTVPVTENRAGRVYEQSIFVEETGDTIVFTVMEPTKMRVGERYPLILHGHGYGGSRNTEPSAFQQRLRDAGYYVISIDQRGFGESSGSVRVLSPDYGGQDLVALLNWAEHLPGLARYPSGKMKVGSYGGSYGGIYQYILAAVDPKERLTVIAPDMAPYNLAYSLAPHGVPKTGWALFLAAAGEVPLFGLFSAEAPETLLNILQEKIFKLNPVNQDLTIIESLLRGAATNHLPDAALRMFRYHSLAYFCQGKPAKPQSGFILAKPDPREVAASGLPEIDALITQGFRDTLFNFNEAFRAYQCLEMVGGDVRLLTHQSGHILPLTPAAVPGLAQLAHFLAPVLNLPGFQEPAGPRKCGSIDLMNATFAWFQAKLKGMQHVLKKALPTGQLICLSLAAGDAIAVEHVQVGGPSFKIQTNTPALSGPLGVLTSLLGAIPRQALLQTQLLYTAPETGAVMAGIPQLDIRITSLLEALPDPKQCTGVVEPVPLDRVANAVPDLPLVSDLLDGIMNVVSELSSLHPRAPSVPALLDSVVDTVNNALPVHCDPVYFFALAERSAGERAWDIIDGQVTPVRGYGHHEINMNGIAIRLAPGDQVALLILGFHLQYPLSFSRDLVVIGATVNGTVELPILSPYEIVRTGV